MSSFKLPSLDNTKAVTALLFLLTTLPFLTLVYLRQLWPHGPLISSDGVGYFCHLPSLLVDGDLDYTNNFAYFGRTGRNHWPVGTAIAWLPFYLIGHLVSIVGESLGYLTPSQGHGLPEQLACCTGSIIYGGFSVCLAYLFCRRWFEPLPSLLAPMTLFATSCLYYYMLCEPYMSHGASAFWVSLLVFLGTDDKELEWPIAALLGVLTGLAALTRPQDGLFLLLPITWHLMRTENRTRTLLRLFLAGIISLALFYPQVELWQTEWQNYSSTETLPQVDEFVPGGETRWAAPHLLQALFGLKDGLCTWHPFNLVAIGGLGLLFSRNKRAATICLLGLLSQMYVVGAWGSQGQAFGARMMSSCFLVLSPGVACLLTRHLRSTLAFATLAALWNVILILAYRSLILKNIPPQSPLDPFLL